MFNAVTASRHERVAAQLGQFLGSIGVGLLGGAVGAAALWLLLRAFGANGPLLALAQLGCVVGVAAVCDALRDDSGLTAAIVMGLAVGNLPHFRLPERQPFSETLVHLVIGVLFVSISATVTPLSVRHRLRPALGVAAILVFVARPLVAWLYTLRSDLTGPERAYVGWMAPRGIVAAATATTFGSGLMAAGAVGADKILPATFVVIVATVTLCGLTAAPVARWLDVVRTSRTRPLLVGGHPWVVALGTALRTVGLDVLMWAGTDADRRRIEQAGLELAAGDMVAAATGEGAELEGVTAVLLLTDEDDFNALASTVLAATTEGPVYRLAPPSSAHGVVAPYTSADPLFGAGLTRAEVTRRFDAGAPIVRLPAGEPVPVGHHPLLKVDRAGRLRSVTAADPASGDPGAVLLLLGSSSPVAGDARPPAPRRP